MRILPRSAIGTGLLAVAVWVGSCLFVWSMLPFVPRYEWAMPRGEIVGFGPNGDILVTVDVSMNSLVPNGAVRVVDVATGNERAVLMPSDTWITWTDMSADGRWLVVGHSPNGLAPDRFSLVHMDNRSVTALPAAGVRGPQTLFSADNRYLVFKASDDSPGIRVFDLVNQRIVVSVPARDPFAISADGRTLAAVIPGSAGAAKMIGIWDVPKGRLRSVVPPMPRWPNGLALSSDGAALAVVPDREQIDDKPRAIAWRTADGNELPVEAGPVGHRVHWDHRLWAVSPGGKESRMVLTDLSAQGVRNRWVAPVDASDCRVSPNGRFLQVNEQYEPPTAPIEWLVSRGYLSEEVWGQTKVRHWRLFDMATDREIARIAGETRGIDWSPDGLLLATGDFEDFRGPISHVHVWDIPPRKPLAWFALAAAIVALPVAGLAWRRSRRLGRNYGIAGGPGT